MAEKGWPSLQLATPIHSRQHYLQRPDLGRRLDQASRATLQTLALPAADVALVVSDGLSSTAVEQHGLPLLLRLSQPTRSAR
nr:ethanolamine ammonia-lyase light chain EutC [Methylomonas koyamae]